MTTQTMNNSEKKVAYDSLNVEPIEDIHLSRAAELWQTQYREDIKSAKIAPKSWLTNMTAFASFIENHSKEKKGIVLKSEEEIIGFMVHDNFEFHGEKTIFCPIMGHAAITSCKELAYKKMYRYISKRWVKAGYLNHLITFFAHDTFLKELLFNLGFGLYVVDVFRSIDPILTDNSEITIKRACIGDAKDAMHLGEESRDFYSEAPLFLIRDTHNIEYYRNLLTSESAAVFLAYINNQAVGIMSIRKNDEDDCYTLADTSSAVIDRIGAYIKLKYRGREIGKKLLQKAVEWCRRTNSENIHVDFESANLYASKFWPKYFEPVLYSVKRKINQDILKG